MSITVSLKSSYNVQVPQECFSNSFGALACLESKRLVSTYTMHVCNMLRASRG